MIIFDVETAALPGAYQHIEPVNPPANYKDPAKISEYIAQKSVEALERAALDPDLCSIRAIGASVNGHRNVTVVGEDCDEPDLLRRWWATMEQHAGVCCGYNLLGFDLPVIAHRSMALGVSATIAISMARYRTGPVCDLYGVLYNWGPGRGLKWVAKRYGLECLMPDVDGADVATMDNQTLRQYMESELHLIEQLYGLMEPVYRLAR